MECFDTFVARDGIDLSMEGHAAGPNGHAQAPGSSGCPSASMSPSLQSSSPHKRRLDSEEPAEESCKTPSKKRRADDVDADAILAAKLQAEENMRARPTRGASSRTQLPKRKQKTKSVSKVTAEDDSFMESGKEKEVNRSGGFHVSISPGPRTSVFDC